MKKTIDKSKKILSVILAMFLFCTSPILNISVVEGKEINTEYIEQDFENLVKRGSLSLWLNKETYEICLFDEKNGARWYSNPLDRDEEKIAMGVNLMNLNSSFILYYRDVEKKVSNSINSYTGAVYDKNVLLKTNKNGFTLYYKFNDIKAIIPLKYELTENSLKCSILSKEIIESKEFPLLSISLLPYFGAGGANDNGYLLIPDGSGALINFNNGKADKGSYIQRVYGHDEVVQLSSKAAYNQSVKLPVFGIKNNDNGIVGIIEKNESLATINATSGGNISSYNTVNASFLLRNVDSYALGESTGGVVTDITIIEENISPKDNLTVAFYPLNKENSDYSGMAAKYKEYYISMICKGDVLNISFSSVSF